MKVAIYARVSTTDQSTDNQLIALQYYCHSRGYEPIEIYQENESAWKNGHQVQLARLLQDCRVSRNRPGIVLVWALDRLSREGAAAILNLVNSFKLYGVKVISLQEPWTEAPGELGELLFAIAGWVARMESQRRSERTKAGISRPGIREKVGKRGPDKKKRQKRVAQSYAQTAVPREVK